MTNEFKLIPVEPTEEMLKAMWSLMNSNGGTGTQACYEALLAAAPVLPTAGEYDETIEELKMMADMCSDNEDPEDQLMYMRWIARIRRGDAEVTRLQAELSLTRKLIDDALSGY